MAADALDRLATALADRYRIERELGTTFEPSDGLLRLLTQVAPFVDSTKAVTFAETRVTRFSDHPSPYEALGDFWAANGEVAKARDYCEQALARDGNPAHINRKIGRLER